MSSSSASASLVCGSQVIGNGINLLAKLDDQRPQNVSGLAGVLVLEVTIKVGAKIDPLPS